MHYFRFKGDKWRPDNLIGILGCTAHFFGKGSIEVGKLIAADLDNIMSAMSEVFIHKGGNLNNDK